MAKSPKTIYWEVTSFEHAACSDLYDMLRNPKRLDSADACSQFCRETHHPEPFAHAKAMAKAAKAETAWYFQAISRKKETHNYFYLDIFWSTGTSIMTVDGQVQ
jgi:hypothetical protein